MTSDWGSGSCTDVGVTNPESHALLGWQVSLALTGSLTSLWDAVGAQQGTLLRVGGASWNARLAPGASTAFGFCSST